MHVGSCLSTHTHADLPCSSQPGKQGNQPTIKTSRQPMKTAGVLSRHACQGGQTVLEPSCRPINAQLLPGCRLPTAGMHLHTITERMHASQILPVDTHIRRPYPAQHSRCWLNPQPLNPADPDSSHSRRTSSFPGARHLTAQQENRHNPVAKGCVGGTSLAAAGGAQTNSQGVRLKT
jgi:hypothetical protein